MWLEETRGGLLFLCILETERAESANGYVRLRYARQNQKEGSYG